MTTTQFDRLPAIDDFLANVAEALRLAFTMKAGHASLHGVVADVRLATLDEVEDMLVRGLIAHQAIPAEIAPTVALGYMRAMLERIHADPTHSFV